MKISGICHFKESIALLIMLQTNLKNLIIWYIKKYKYRL